MTNNKRFVVGGRTGQSLFEVIIGLAVGVVLIGAGTFAISVVLRSHVTLQKSQSATAFAQGLLAKLPSAARADWSSIAALSHGSSSMYFLIASSTLLMPVAGVEGLFDNDVTSGLVARWGFDEVAATTFTTTYDVAGNGYHGTITNGPTRATSTCRVGNCLSFDGVDDFVNYGSPGVLNFGNNPFTLSVWFKNTNPSGYDTIMGKGGFWANDEYQLYTISGSVYFYVDKGGTKYFTSFPVVANEWYHVVGTYDGSSIQLYVNGNFVTQTPVSNINLTNGTSFRVGGTGTDSFSGLIDEVRVYNRALLSGEIQRLYAAKKFTRSFYVETACRSIDSASAVSGVEPCLGGTAPDPSTLKATVTVGSLVGVSDGSTAATTYLIRSGTEAFRQTDWSGGAGESAPVVHPSSGFVSSTNTDVTAGGSIRIHGL